MFTFSPILSLSPQITRRAGLRLSMWRSINAQTKFLQRMRTKSNAGKGELGDIVMSYEFSLNWWEWLWQLVLKWMQKKNVSRLYLLVCVEPNIHHLLLFFWKASLLTDHSCSSCVTRSTSEYLIRLSTWLFSYGLVQGSVGELVC